MKYIKCETCDGTGEVMIVKVDLCRYTEVDKCPDCIDGYIEIEDSDYEICQRILQIS